MEPWIRYMIIAIFILLCIDIAQNWRGHDIQKKGTETGVPGISFNRDGKEVTFISNGKKSSFNRCSRPRPEDSDRIKGGKLAGYDKSICKLFTTEAKVTDKTNITFIESFAKGSAWCFRHITINGEEYEQERHYSNRDNCPLGWTPQ